MKSFKFSETASGLPVMGYQFGSDGARALILGGVHGDETEGVVAALSLLNHFEKSFTYKLNLTLVPQFNLDGVLHQQRKNANSIDLNRNLPTNDWTNDVPEEKYYPGPEACSEPENKGLVNWLEANKPHFVLSLHSWKPLLNVNGNCGPEAEILNQRTGYEIKDSIGYPTPGCLGTYTGLERDMPTITYELERGMDEKKIISDHVPAILECLKATEGRA